jgi:hypothetical protein
LPRATASCTRSSGDSPASSIATSTRWASDCGSIARAAPYRTPRRRSDSTTSATSYDETRQRRDPRGTSSPSAGAVTWDQSARRSTSASRGSPFRVATAASSVPCTPHRGFSPLSVRLTSSPMVDCVASISPSAGSTSRM